MDSDLKCNRLTCRTALIERAVVTTCSHIFCVECANELFNVARLCPACETSLTEPDDVVVCSLNPTNDYKTSVLSGLSPSVILEICSRALSFWQYQVHQENLFQHAVTRNLNDRNAQLQKQLDNVIREANSEISLMTNKTAELERDLEVERRKVHELQEGSREREKEYQKLKNQHEKVKRKALLVPSAGPPNGMQKVGGETRHPVDPAARLDIEAVVGGMEAVGLQRTPLVSRNMNSQVRSNSFQYGTQLQRVPHSQHRQTADATNRRHQRNFSDRSESANEVENMLLPSSRSRPTISGGNVPAFQRGTAFKPARPQPQTSNPLRSPRSTELISSRFFQ